MQLYNMISKVKLEYYKVYGENLHLGTGGLSDDTIIFRDNFSNMISVGFSRKVIISENSQKFSYVNLFFICLSSISILKCRSAL